MAQISSANIQLDKLEALKSNNMGITGMVNTKRHRPGHL